MNEIINAYTAGLFDGEGWIIMTKCGPYKRHKQANPIYNIRAGIETTDLEILAYLRNIYGGSLYTRPKKRAEKRRLTHTWYFDGRSVDLLLEKIYPYLRLKKPKAKLAIEYAQHLKSLTSSKARLKPGEVEFRQKFFENFKSII